MRIRQQLLDEQERLGLLRAHSNYDSIPIENISTRLKYLGEYSDDLNEKERRQKLKEIETTRYLTCWADHSTIAGHTYVLYTFSCLYDEAVFVAKTELSQRLANGIDVEELVGKPQIHIIA